MKISIDKDLQQKANIPDSLTQVDLQGLQKKITESTGEQVSVVQEQNEVVVRRLLID